MGGMEAGAGVGGKFRVIPVISIERTIFAAAFPYMFITKE